MYNLDDVNEHRKKVQENILKAFHEEDLFEKAHFDGEVHPNGKWVWRSSVNNGKGDWRMMKRTDKTTTTTTEATAEPKTKEEDKKVYNVHPDGTPIDLSKMPEENIVFAYNLVKQNISEFENKIKELGDKKPKTLKMLTEKLEDQKGKFSELKQELDKRKNLTKKR